MADEKLSLIDKGILGISALRDYDLEKRRIEADAAKAQFQENKSDVAVDTNGAPVGGRKSSITYLKIGVGVVAVGFLALGAAKMMKGKK